ncbi:MAG TPA: flagellar hook protein FlgE [Burkholderiales bacterium]|nr:flagellar hook protein FlgE [Burkholderiales bacterium]
MSFQQGLSGLDGASKALDVIGNNVANANTVGFKSSDAHFGDVYANSLGGAGSNQVGIGTSVETVMQNFTQGNITTTSNPLDLAINGQGFFRMSDSGAITYARNGQFHLDASGYIVDDNGRNLTGYPVDANGNIVQAAPVDLQVVTSTQSPKTTTQATANFNLPAGATAITAAFDPTDPTTYTNSTSFSVYDSQGFAHTVALYFAKTATSNDWNAYATVDGTATSYVNLGAGAGNPAVVDFGGSGAMTTAMPLNVSIDLAGITTALGGATSANSPLAFTLDFGGTTQFGSPFSINSLTQDGYGSGQLTNISVSVDGVILGNYSNGQSTSLGQVVLANFNNPNGLAPLGGSQWAETSASGLPQVAPPGTSNLGVLQSAAVEESNVDLTTQLVDMITLQRDYQANAQSIKTQDTVLQSLVNLP